MKKLEEYMAHWGSSSQPETMHFGLKKKLEKTMAFPMKYAGFLRISQPIHRGFQRPSSSSQAAASVEAATEPAANGQTFHLR